jgi:hypothetical protein
MKRAFKVITERDARKGDRQEIFLAMDWRLVSDRGCHNSTFSNDSISVVKTMGARTSSKASLTGGEKSFSPDVTTTPLAEISSCKSQLDRLTMTVPEKVNSIFPVGCHRPGLGGD